MNILKVIQKISNNIELTKEEIRANENVIKKANENGFNLISQYNIEMRDLINNDISTKVLPLQYKTNDIQKILDSTQYIEGAKSSFKFPFITNNNVSWGVPQGNGVIESKELKPHRISTQLDMSINVINSNSEDIQKQFTEMLINSIYQKMIQTAFSSESENLDTPKGLFNGITEINISDITSLQTMQNKVDTFSDTASWFISPKMKNKLFEINSTNQIFVDGKLLGNEYNFTNLVQENKICYIDLSKVAISNFGVIGITVDNFTQKANGNVRITVDAFFDFDVANENYISVGIISNE